MFTFRRTTTVMSHHEFQSRFLLQLHRQTHKKYQFHVELMHNVKQGYARVMLDILETHI